MDKLSVKQRSKLMSRVRSKNTSIEVKVRKLLFRLGYRYRIHYPGLNGRPDIVFPKRKKIIFVNGCFWHGHVGCHLAKLPQSNKEFWSAKIEANKLRDRRNIESAEQDGWGVLVIWQCQMKDMGAIEELLISFLD